MLALASDEGLCALEFTGPNEAADAPRGAAARAGSRRTRSSTARRGRSRGRATWLDRLLRRHERRHQRTCRSTCAAPRSSSACGRRCAPSRRAQTTSYGAIAQSAWIRRRLARRRRGQRRQPDRDHRALPSRDRRVRIADRLRRRPRAQDVAASITSAAGATSRRRRCSRAEPRETARSTQRNMILCDLCVLRGYFDEQELAQLAKRRAAMADGDFCACGTSASVRPYGG